MTVRLRAEGDTGTVAIYTGNDNAPFNNPLNNVSRLRFHSDLDYPKIVRTLTGTLTIAGLTSPDTRITTHQVGNHQQNGQPFCEGWIKVNGTNPRVPLIGSVCIRQGHGGANDRRGFGGNWVHLGSNGTKVLIAEYSLAMQGDSKLASSVDIDYEIYITDTTV